MRSVILLFVALTVLSSVVYWQAGTHEFVNFDDEYFVVRNEQVTAGLTKDGILWALSPTPGLGWFPVAWLSHMADVELYGLNPRGHHLTSVFLHIAATLLLFTLLYRATRASWPSAFVATLFALHPLHVESVAWIAERRDVLSAFFGFLALLLYIEYVIRGRRRFYAAALVAFVLGLMSKPMLVTLPVIMLLLDFWPLDRQARHESVPAKTLRDSSLIKFAVEKIPFFVAAIVTVFIGINTPGLDLASDVIPLGQRLAHAPVAYLKYLGKTLWPSRLAFYYPFPPSIPAWQTIGSLLALFGITTAIILARRRAPYLLSGWLWFLLTLVPVLGLVQIGGHAIADRYMYLPSVGLFIIAAWGGPQLLSGFRWRRLLLASLAVPAVAICTALTWRQIGTWQNSQALYQHALRVTSGNYVAHYYLGYTYAKGWRLDEAIEQYQKTVAINPRMYQAYNSLGLAYAKTGELDQALESFGKAITLKADYIEARYNLAVALSQAGRLPEAIKAYREVLRLNPGHKSAGENLHIALDRLRSTERTE